MQDEIKTWKVEDQVQNFWSQDRDRDSKAELATERIFFRRKSREKSASQINREFGQPKKLGCIW